jgi:hypothetical protein
VDITLVAQIVGMVLRENKFAALEPQGRIREMSVKSRTYDSKESYLRSLRDFSLGGLACGIELFVAGAGFGEAELKIEN